MMIIRSRAPLRISFGGGGTEISPYLDNFGGLTLSTTIQNYAYTTIKPIKKKEYRFFSNKDKALILNKNQLINKPIFQIPENYRISIASIRKLISVYKNDISGIEMYFGSDAPKGSGLGASSVLTVASVKALDNLMLLHLTKDEVAKLAYETEREMLQLSGGKQDHYASSFGGLNFVTYHKEGNVAVERLDLTDTMENELQSSLLLIYTGTSRKSATIIDKQKKFMSKNDPQIFKSLDKIKSLANDMRKALLNGSIPDLGKLLDESWRVKKQITTEISNKHIDLLYAKALKMGAYGGKITGAGGGGYLVLLVPPEKRQNIFENLSNKSHFELQAKMGKEGALSWRTE